MGMKHDVPPGATLGKTTAAGIATLTVSTPYKGGPWSDGLPWRLDVPGLIVVSEANRREHWAKRRKRRLAQVEMLLAELWKKKHPGPAALVITMTRQGGRKMDSDNLAGSFKAVRDALAKWLGRDDGDESLRWEYRQCPGKGAKGITIEVAEVVRAA